MKRRIAIWIAAFVIGCLSTVAAAVLLVISGYEADLHPPAGDDVLGWSFLAGGATLTVASFTAIVITLTRASRRRTA